MNQIKNFNIMKHFKRPSDMNLHELLVEYDQKRHELKRDQIVITESLLGFNLLKSANLNNLDQDRNI